MPNSIYIVYKTTNKINNKYYIGVHHAGTKNGRYLGSGTLLKRAINKYGKENFIRETLFTYYTHQEAYQKEGELVDETKVNDDNCYNIIVGGRGVPGGKLHPLYGVKQSEETINKRLQTIANRSEAQKQETSRRLSIASLGRTPTEEAKKNMSLAQKGKIVSKETILLQREAQPNNKPCIIKGLEFDSIASADRHFGLSANRVKEWIKNPKNTYCFLKEDQEKMDAINKGVSYSDSIRIKKMEKYLKNIMKTLKRRLPRTMSESQKAHLRKWHKENYIVKSKSREVNSKKCSINGVIYNSVRDAALNYCKRHKTVSLWCRESNTKKPNCFFV